MYAYTKITDYEYLETSPVTENLDELWADDDFCDDLIDAINENFVLEVEASRARED